MATRPAMPFTARPPTTRAPRHAPSLCPAEAVASLQCQTLPTGCCTCSRHPLGSCTKAAHRPQSLCTEKQTRSMTSAVAPSFRRPAVCMLGPALHAPCCPHQTASCPTTRTAVIHIMRLPRCTTPQDQPGPRQGHLPIQTGRPRASSRSLMGRSWQWAARTIVQHVQCRCQQCVQRRWCARSTRRRPTLGHLPDPWQYHAIWCGF